MRVAYADPPYPGDAHMYGQREVNHERLIAALRRFDGWALSTSSDALHLIAPLCGPDVRCAAWVKTSGTLGNGRAAIHAWEPVFFVPCRQWKRSRDNPIVFDWLKSPRQTKITGALRGHKPPEFCGWLFDILGLEPDDDFHDMFHGSGAVKRAWTQWRTLKRCGGPLFVQGGS